MLVAVMGRVGTGILSELGATGRREMGFSSDGLEEMRIL
jgi:hypothetical protein